MKIIYKIKQLLSNSILLLRSAVSRTPERIRHKVLYVSQFASPSWAEMVLKDDQPLARDLAWEDSGARSIKEYERWALTTCGMACTSMLLLFFNKGEFRTIPLARDAAKSGVYLKDGDGISSMQYQPYTTWLKRFGLRATIYTRLTPPFDSDVARFGLTRDCIGKPQHSRLQHCSSDADRGSSSTHHRL